MDGTGMGNEFGAPAAARGGRNYGGNYIDDDGIERDRWDRPILPHPETGVVQSWTRPSTLARTLDDEYLLNQWKCRQVAYGVAKRPDLVALAASADPNDRRTLNDVADQAMAYAKSAAGANLGSALHKFLHRYDRNPAGAGEWAHEVPVELLPTLAAYGDGLARYGLRTDPRYIECLVANTQINAAGSFDRLLLCADGAYRVADIKTGQELDYSWLYILIQLATYANSVAIWRRSPDAAQNPRSGVWEALPANLDRTTGLVIHLPSGGTDCTVYRIDLTEGWKDAQTAALVRERRRVAKTFVAPLAASGAPTAAVMDQLGQALVTSTSGNPLQRAMGESMLEAADQAGIGDPEPAPLASEARQDAAMPSRRAEDITAEKDLLRRIRGARTQETLLFLAQQYADRWTPEMQGAAAERWEQLKGGAAGNLSAAA